MPATTREELLSRLEAAMDAGRGIELDAGEVQLLGNRPAIGRSLPVEHAAPIEGLDHVGPGCVRWLIRRDMPHVMGIEAIASESPWSEEEWHAYLTRRDCIGMVFDAEARGGGNGHTSDQICGVCLYELHKGHIRLLRFIVRPDLRRRGVGRAIIERLAGKLHEQRRTHITVDVPERLDEAIRFFARCGFTATGMADSDEDAIAMRYTLPVSAAQK